MSAPTEGAAAGAAEGEAGLVRPYAVIGGRTPPSSADMPLEALVIGLSTTETGLTLEKRQILELTATQFLSVAEVSARVHLLVPVARVVLRDLVDDGKVKVYVSAMSSAASRPGAGPAATGAPDPGRLAVLQSVLDGIAAL